MKQKASLKDKVDVNLYTGGMFILGNIVALFLMLWFMQWTVSGVINHCKKYRAVEIQKYMLKSDCAITENHYTTVKLDKDTVCEEMELNMAKESLVNCEYYYLFCTGYDNSTSTPCDYATLTPSKSLKEIEECARRSIGVDRIFKMYKCGEFIKAIKSNNYMRN